MKIYGHDDVLGLLDDCIILLGAGARINCGCDIVTLRRAVHGWWLEEVTAILILKPHYLHIIRPIMRSVNATISLRIQVLPM